jgi:hypothetical protein
MYHSRMFFDLTGQILVEAKQEDIIILRVLHETYITSVLLFNHKQAVCYSG